RRIDGSGQGVRRQHHAPGCRDADGRCATNNQLEYRRSHGICIATGDELLRERQAALIEQFKPVAFEGHRANAVVAGVIVDHFRVSRGMGWPLYPRAFANARCSSSRNTAASTWASDLMYRQALLVLCLPSLESSSVYASRSPRYRVRADLRGENASSIQSISRPSG